MAIIGFVDGMEGGYVIGWAANPPDTASCVITITDDDGHILATGKAARRRPDLSVLGLGRVSLGFRIPVTCGTAPHRLHVRANSEDISDTPLKAGAGQYDAVCQIKEGRLTGWVTERCSHFAPPYIKAINQNGMIVAAGQASIDAGEIDPFFAPARFALDLADACFGAGEQLLVVYAGDVAVARLTCTLSLQGNLDELNTTSCAGWLLSPEAPARIFTVQIFRDGKKSGEAICNVPRDDVRAIHPGCGKPGFGFTFPPPAPDPLSISMISLRLPGAVTDLFAGPYAVGSRAAAITAAQRASQLSYRLEKLGPAERSVLQQALTEFITQARRGDKFLVPNQARDARPSRLAIIIPVYRGIEATQACIDSVLAHRDSATHQLVIINDGSPEAEMAPMLASYYGEDNVALLNNPENLGFVQTVNRGLNFCIGADVLLLNADTILHAGGLAELQRAAYASPEIGTVTALSNNATIFSYPSIDLQTDALDDIGWAELAAAALKENAGLVVDVPTGHGFCLFIKAEVLRRVGRLDEAFGRGYGEENDFCARAASLGYRNVAAAGVIVEHRESISFAGERPSLIAQNMPRLNTLYPEYMPVVTEFERQDGMRRARWALDRLRLARAAAAGAKFSLVVSNGLDGGTKQAIADFERAANSKNVSVLRLRAQESGLLELSCESPAIAANFLPNETDDLLALLHAANPAHVQLHQLLGFPSHFIATMQDWAKTRHAIYFAHDFYAICPRVTMIDAIGRFCDVADTGTCARCIEMGGAHEASRLTELTPAAHRALFSGLLASMTHVVAPSANAAGYLQRAFPGLAVQAIPHPEQHAGIATTARAGNFDEILLLGAIGPHKGSDKLLEIARRARLTHPHLNFRIIGYTNMDEKLEKIGNVTITGKYSAETLPALINATEGKLALFLSTWPETYSYTLSEVVKYGFVPLVPDIGAPAERVRAAKFGAVFPFPIDAETVLNLLDAIAAGQIPTHAAGATPAAFMPTEADLARAATILFPQPAFSAPKKVKKSK